MNKDTLPRNACEEGAAYYNAFKTGQAFWEACVDRPDWMLWAHARSSCPVPWAYVALAEVWAQDAARYAADAAGAADAAARYAGAAARYAARYADAAAHYAARYADAAAHYAAAAGAAAHYAAAHYADAADAARYAARYAADAAARKRQCEDIRAALPYFPGFSTTKESVIMSDSMRMYVADLAAYNAGNLVGAWLDLEGKDADELREEIAELLKKWTTEEPREEWAAHDYENVKGFGEYPDLEKLADHVRLTEEHGEAWALYVDHVGAHYATEQGFEECYRGCSRSAEDFAEQYLEDTGAFQGAPDLLRNYFDFEKYVRDLKCEGMAFIQGADGVHVFDNN